MQTSIRTSDKTIVGDYNCYDMLMLTPERGSFFASRCWPYSLGPGMIWRGDCFVIDTIATLQEQPFMVWPYWVIMSLQIMCRRVREM